MLQLHGSGKTSVLVERIINKVINDKIDIDKILIVTFTSSAASEMRERILNAIYQKIEQSPENADLQRQIILLNRANISTIHSFCLDVIRNNFFEIDTSANFRVADGSEIDLLKLEIIDDLFEQKYLDNNEEFEKLLNLYTNYRGDEDLKKLILSIYEFIQSSPFPEDWLNEQVEKFNLKDKLDNDFSKTVWGQILLTEFEDILIDSRLKLKQLENKLSVYEEMVKYRNVILNDIAKIEDLQASVDSWEELYLKTLTLKFDTWPTDKKITLDIKDEAKGIRTNACDKIKKIKNDFFIFNSKQANTDINEMYEILKSIKNLVIDFTEMFSKRKKERNIVDFSDIEHFALKILVKVDENGRKYESEIAKKYKEKFEEIAIDEYQDSNLVQEYILKSVSRGNNIFMVGDVKQSIYKFRQARPELFLEKYNTYKLRTQDNKDDINIENGMKIQLFKNFRSRANVLDITNLIFENIMSLTLGNINYDENEFLNYGANYPELESGSNYAGIAELDIINTKVPEPDVYTNLEEDNTEEDEPEAEDERVDDIVVEAKFVAKRIKEIIDSNYLVYDRKIENYRKVTYKDIVVLLRSTKVAAPIFENEIANINMPVFSDVSSEYLESLEIQTIINLLKVIDNPMQDIPLVTILRSCICGFTDNELVLIRGEDKNISFYESLVKYKCEDEDLNNKIKNFLNSLKRWQDEEKYMSLDELIWQIYSDTNFYNYVTLLSNGGLRQANLKMLFERAKQYETGSFKGLFNFINFIEKIHSSNGDVTSAKLIGENENVVRIMSIHKSKGLEFPVVFLSNMGKNFNLQDLNDNIILHQDLGFGPKYINFDSKIEYSTLAKEAIKLQAKVETLSEEMRVLYVGLTRAKEKLIITGTCKDVDKSFKEKEALISMYEGSTKCINPILLKKYKSYLDWIELVYFNNKEDIEKYVTLNVIGKYDFLKALNQEEETEKQTNIKEQLEEQIQNLNKKNIKVLKEKLNWKYMYMDSSVIPTKTSVTKLKEAENERMLSIEELEEKKNEEISKFAIARPQFLNEEVQITAAQKGTLMHLCFQKLDETKEYTKEMLQNMVKDLVNRQVITELEGKAINTYKLYMYTKSELFKELKIAKEIHKEQPFYINLTADEIFKNGLKDNILVQGIIDLYYINQEDQVVLVDYKTDYVANEKDLKEKYKVQLEIYKKALEQSLNKKVKKCYIYSVYLEKLIKI